MPTYRHDLTNAQDRLPGLTSTDVDTGRPDLLTGCPTCPPRPTSPTCLTSTSGKDLDR